MKDSISSTYKQQIALFRSTHFGRDPGRVTRLGYKIRAILGTGKTLQPQHGTRNSLLKIKARSIQLQNRIKTQAGQSPDSSSKHIPRTITADEFKRLAAEGDYSAYGDNILIDGDLDLSDIPTITKLPKSLYVDGDLILTGCKELEALPEKKLRVTGSLTADKCSNLKEITEDIQVGENLSFKQCHHLTVGHLPTMLRTMRYRADSTTREIHLEDTTVDDYAVKIAELSGEGVKFYISNPLGTTVSKLIKSSSWSDGHPELDYNKFEATILRNWLRIISSDEDIYRTRNALTILVDEMRDPINKQIVINILSGINYKFSNDYLLALEFINKILNLRKINQSPADPDTQKKLMPLFAKLFNADVKKFSSYQKAPSQPGSERLNGIDRIPEFRKALLLALNLPEDTSNPDIPTMSGF